MRAGRFFLSAALCLVMVSVGAAQTSKGILAGVAHDQTGAVVGKAQIIVTNQDTGEARTIETRPDGSYRVDAISPGLYTIKIEVAGFETVNVKDVSVRATIVTSYDPTLTVGQVTSTVAVEAGANTINTENGALSGTIGQTEITNVPIFSLNPIELATTVPGVQPALNGGTSNGYNIEVNGLRPRANNFLIDGQDINDNSIGGQGFSRTFRTSFRRCRC